MLKLVALPIAFATAADAHSVHVVADLLSDGEHWYRWRVGQYTSPVGRTSRHPVPPRGQVGMGLEWPSATASLQRPARSME